MTRYADMTYDEQRAFLGLPDVRFTVRRLAVLATYRRFQVATREASEAITAFGREFSEAWSEAQRRDAVRSRSTYPKRGRTR